MANNKKILVSLPENLLDEVDEYASETYKNRSQFIREAIISYIKERKRIEMIENMKKGYLEMAKINIELAECGITVECEELAKYEAGLAESDNSNGSNSEKRRYILC
ncbi:CopG family transcriptional regulator / antitoxin EndoAI [Caloramator fervidus]|uniref:CopG family transcriptional regulator / antitoxin EndoAI n=1 Tax=Caloramator fervidus TaxID=29344 RepID=A0A1H5TEG0_9CLOT|nr:ribbon-helix-helix protein, CopG family [Caloramator fervidus]SEF60397.1 CopG family transcriptional regulator / antitoxin EndoAI [Caloramator fervidus]